MEHRWVVSCLLGVGLLYAQNDRASSDRPRIFIETSQAWQMTGGGGWGSVGGGGGIAGGTRPQTVEIMRTFQQRCPAVRITNRREAADYVVSFDREGGKDIVRKDNKIAVFNRDGDLVHTSSTRSVGNAVKNACAVITGQP